MPNRLKGAGTKAAMKAKAVVSALAMPKTNPADFNGTSPTTPKTPKTPADEGIEFFESAVAQGEPIRVYELRLDPDGGPNKDRSVEYFPIRFLTTRSANPITFGAYMRS